jgi:hypothetical protein
VGRWRPFRRAPPRRGHPRAANIPLAATRPQAALHLAPSWHLRRPIARSVACARMAARCIVLCKSHSLYGPYGGLFVGASMPVDLGLPRCCGTHRRCACLGWGAGAFGAWATLPRGAIGVPAPAAVPSLVVSCQGVVWVGCVRPPSRTSWFCGGVRRCSNLPPCESAKLGSACLLVVQYA